MNSEKWKVILCSAINLSIVPFLLSTGLRKLVCARSLVKSFVKSTDLYAGLIRLAICHVWHWCPLASGQHPLFSLPISPASPFQHPLIPPNSTLKCLSCTELCSRPSPHSYPSSRFQQLPISSYSQILSTAHPSSIHARAHTHTHTYTQGPSQNLLWTLQTKLTIFLHRSLTTSILLPSNYGTSIVCVSKHMLWNLIELGLTPRYTTYLAMDLGQVT